MNRKELYEHYEGTSQHIGTPEVEVAEKEFGELIRTITDPSLRSALDQAVGKVARAYEMQGFCMAIDVMSRSDAL